MKDSTLRAIDRWVGVPACAVLTLHRRLFRRRERPLPLRRILFIKLAEQGATVLASGALDRAQDLVGRDNVYFLSFRENRFILDAMGIVPPANVLTIDARTPATTLRSLVAVIRRMRALRIDAAIGLEFFARSSAILAYMSGACSRVGLHSYAGEGPYAGNLLTHPLVYNPYLHTHELFLAMVEALRQPGGRFPAFDMRRLPVAETLRAYEPTIEDLGTVRRLVCEATASHAPPPLILLNANCRDALPLRRWGGDRYVELARRLLEALPDVHVLFTGAAVEAGEAQRLTHAVSSARCASLAGRTTVPQLLALFGLADVLVTNDSGPAHFAALTPIDVVTLFGPETPALFGARTPRNHVLWAGLVCSPCVSAFNNRVSKCRDNVCMQRITVDQVFETVTEVYRRRTASQPAQIAQP